MIFLWPDKLLKNLPKKKKKIPSNIISGKEIESQR